MLSIICLSAWRNNKGQTSWLPVNYHHMLHLLPGASKVQKLSQGLHWLWRTKFMPKRRIMTCCVFSAGSRTTASKYTILQILGSFRLFFYYCLSAHLVILKDEKQVILSRMCTLKIAHESVAYSKLT